MEQLLSPEEMRLVAGLRRGDEAAFAELMRMYGAAMLRVAQMYVSSRSVAEEVVQDAWIGVFRGIDRFEGRSSLKTWLFRILSNTAKTRGVREGRSVPVSSLGEGESAVDAERFFDSAERWAGHWAVPPESWAAQPEGRLLAREAMDVIEREIEKLPEQQALVLTLRDVEGFSSEDVCNVLDISETNQRVLLHRARSKVRRALEEYLR